VLARVSKTSGGALDIMEHAYPSSLDDEALPLSRFVSPSSGRLEIFLERAARSERGGLPERRMSEAREPRLVER